MFIQCHSLQAILKRWPREVKYRLTIELGRIFPLLIFLLESSSLYFTISGGVISVNLRLPSRVPSIIISVSICFYPHCPWVWYFGSVLSDLKKGASFLHASKVVFSCFRPLILRPSAFFWFLRGGGCFCCISVDSDHDSIPDFTVFCFSPLNGRFLP